MGHVATLPVKRGLNMADAIPLRVSQTSVRFFMTADLHDVGSVADQLGCGLMLLLITQDVEACIRYCFLRVICRVWSGQRLAEFPEFVPYDP